MYQYLLAANLFKRERFKHPSKPGTWFTCTSEPYEHDGYIRVPCTYNSGRRGIRSIEFRFDPLEQVTVWKD